MKYTQDKIVRSLIDLTAKIKHRENNPHNLFSCTNLLIYSIYMYIQNMRLLPNLTLMMLHRRFKRHKTTHKELSNNLEMYMQKSYERLVIDKESQWQLIGST